MLIMTEGWQEPEVYTELKKNSLTSYLMIWLKESNNCWNFNFKELIYKAIKH